MTFSSSGNQRDQLQLGPDALLHTGFILICALRWWKTIVNRMFLNKSYYAFHCAFFFSIRSVFILLNEDVTPNCLLYPKVLNTSGIDCSLHRGRGVGVCPQSHAFNLKQSHEVMIQLASFSKLNLLCSVDYV